MLDDFSRKEGQRHLHRGLALERDNRLAEAVEEYRRAITNNPHLREAHDALAFYYQRTGLLAKAAEEFRTVANLEQDFRAYFNLGFVLVELERYDEALESFQYCIKLVPDNPAAHFEIGFVYFSQGSLRMALDHLSISLRSYPEDWELYNLLGKCHLGLRHYSAAQDAFVRALSMTTAITAQAELLENLAMIERHREFRNLSGAKDQLYADDGVVYLGSAQDDGIYLSEAQDYHFTYPDIGTTVQRMLALQQASRWSFTAVVSVDRLSEPLACAIAQLLDLPLSRVDTLTATDSALLVLAVGREVELLILAIERAPCPTMAFCLGLNWLRYSRVLPDLIGIAARGTCSMPWEAELRRLRADGSPPELIVECVQHATHQIMRAIQETPLDTNLPRQVRYYTRQHRRLNFTPPADHP